MKVFIANSGGSIQVIALVSKQKMECNEDNCHALIMLVRVGITAGMQGPFIFLAKGTKNIQKSLEQFGIQGKYFSWFASGDVPERIYE